MKTGSDFKMSKETKRMLASMTPNKRSLWKSLMIEAEVSAKKARLAKLNLKPEKGDE